MAIDSLKIMRAIMEGSKIRDEKGIIPLFGVYLSLYFTSYYNVVSFNFLSQMEKSRAEEAEKTAYRRGPGVWLFHVSWHSAILGVGGIGPAYA